MRKLRFYTRNFKKKHIKKPIIITMIFAFIMIIGMYRLISLCIPILATYCENSGEYIALSVTNEAINECTSNITYESLISMNKDEKTNIVTLSANVTEMNKVSSKITTLISDKLEKITSKNVAIPITTLLNIPLVNGFGPMVSLKIVPLGTVSSSFKSDFEDAGINQVRHRIYIEVSTTVSLIAPFVSESKTYASSIMIAETVIVGIVPNTYYNIDGVENMTYQDTVNTKE